MHWLTSFDSSEFIFSVLNKHWLVLWAVWGMFKIYAKHSKTTVDDEIVEVVEDLRRERAGRVSGECQHPGDDKNAQKTH